MSLLQCIFFFLFKLREILKFKEPNGDGTTKEEEAELKRLAETDGMAEADVTAEQARAQDATKREPKRCWGRCWGGPNAMM